MGASYLWRRKLLRFVVAACLVTSFTIILWPEIEHHHEITTRTISNITITSEVECEPDFDALQRLDVRKLSQYVRREIVVSPSSGDVVPIAQQLEVPLFESIHKDHRFAEDSLHQDDCLMPRPVSVTVPPIVPRADASHIDFGVATTLERLNESLDAFTHWAGYTNTRILALIEPDARINEVLTKARILGVNLLVTESTEEYQHRYFSLVPHLAKNLRPETRWTCVIDDDTFFPSMTALVQALSKYDDSAQTYVGGLSEAMPQVGIFGLMGFGGAGVFMSRPLIEQLGRKDVYEDCQKMDSTGDRKISLCIYQYSDAHLTIDHRLRQIDMRGDVSGFFEAARPPPLSVHHWKSWFNTDMAKLGVVSEICGDSCLLRKWHFGDGWILTNGFSIVKYSNIIPTGDKSMELTWSGDNGAVFESFLHELGPLRPRDEGKISYTHEDAVIDGNRVRQWYIRRDPELGDKVLELIWRRE
ncbi:glycosyltransferase family 31 protein [Aspergillus saccharolyticus JOP 1030-1]|uniref:Fringe-like glycosyltransferase domain-containing protein n=1 Tax=Aspergillus saccharolyticus JOP 1030-1 TaxID=1450539 RepID=A0A318Z1U8_9EURO|nr:hypothetical protein BP01DRAFT_369950 [Aspergillus saccharolyticus JOP 1030-1]PYH40364.1 hypothetical protein BP01DRAFT_369950 [Aspergillus saccharolyticus JOP 1030-1]